MRESTHSNLIGIMNRFKSIISQLKTIDSLRQISSVLSWDQETYMPADAINARADQLETIAGLIHDAWQSDALKNDLLPFINSESEHPKEDLTTDEASFIRELYAVWKRHNQLSKDLVKALTKATATSQHVWANARKNNNFQEFAPHLKELIDLTNEKIKQLGFIDHPYNTLIDEFEPGMNVKKIDSIFEPLKTGTIDFLSQYKPAHFTPIEGPFDSSNQRIYSDELVKLLGFRTQNGRLDISTHPFTIDIHPSDVRITTRINPEHLMESVSSTIHEVGHGLYEQGLDPDWIGTPYGAARSMGIHESQSRLWEIFIGQSRPFWKGQLKRIHELFPTTRHNTADDFVNFCGHVKPHWCRVESDIVTYNLHIIIRYECEKALFSNQLSVNDLPDFWNQKMHDYLGLSIESDTKGCLQDVHWSAGLFGYFPSYTLGTLIAAQLNQTLHHTFPDYDALIESGDFKQINEWLNQHIHRVGSKKPTDDILADLNISYDPQAFLNSLY